MINWGNMRDLISRVGHNRVGGKQSSFLPTLFSDLSHHRTYGSRIRRFLSMQL
jgi:hypothetical protein